MIRVRRRVLEVAAHVEGERQQPAVQVHHHVLLSRDGGNVSQGHRRRRRATRHVTFDDRYRCSLTWSFSRVRSWKPVERLQTNFPRLSKEARRNLNTETVG